MNQASPLSDATAVQFFKQYGTSSLPIVWAGRPQLGWGTGVRLLLLLLMALFGAGWAGYALWGATFGWIVKILAVGLLLFSIIIIIGVIALTRRILSSYYAFDTQDLYCYSASNHLRQAYALAKLPDFYAHAHADGSFTLRCLVRHLPNQQGRAYKTPILYHLPNGQEVLELLTTTQQAARQRALDEQATPSWLPRD